MGRLVVIVAACLLLLLYLRSPIDLVPDRIGVPGLIDDLLAVVLVVWWLRRRGAVQPRPRPSARQRARGPQGWGSDRADAGAADAAGAADEPVWDPWAVLGIAHDASREDITRAYREQMKRYHPDRVADLGEELQALAHRKAQEIQRAYAELGER